MGYTLGDVDSAGPDEVVKSIGSIDGVLAARYRPAAAE